MFFLPRYQEDPAPAINRLIDQTISYSYFLIITVRVKRVVVEGSCTSIFSVQVTG